MRTELFLIALVGCGEATTMRVQHVATACGPGTHLEGDTCVLDETRFEIRVPRKLVNQPRRNRILVTATNPDGTPLVDDVVISFDPPAAGALSWSEVRISRLGGETFFVPCDPENVPSCPTSMTITVARAADPATPVASADIELRPAAEVSPAKDCLTGGNRLRMFGNDQMLDGSVDLVDAQFTFPPDGVNAEFWRATVTGSNETWLLDFNTTSIVGDLVIGKTYDNIQRATSTFSDQKPFRAAMYIRRPGVECTTVTGSFTVLDHELRSFPFQSKTATFAFEQRCEGDPHSAITGCVHFQHQ
jgi:hypothetical protein